MAQSSTRGTIVGMVQETPIVQVTKTAAEKIAALLLSEGTPDMALRVSVAPGGCSGFRYEMYFDSDFVESDSVTESYGVRVAIDATSAPLLAGAVLDYADTLNAAGFKIENPNANRTCGCQKSFS